MASTFPKKSLGQHFLIDENIAKKVVGSMKLNGIKRVIEVGPGRGILSKYLFADDRFSTVIVEIDRNNTDILKATFPGYIEQIIQQDFLKYEIEPVDSSPVALIGNFPYNISSPIFFKILDNRNKISEVVCMIQKEVAERISSGPGSKVYGILSVLLQAYYRINYLFTVSPKVFYPVPKVYSSVVRFERNNTIALDCDEVMFFKVVKTCFNQRRKTIKNAIRNLMGLTLPEHELLQKRPEQLSVSQFVELTNLIQAFRPGLD